MVKFWIKNKFYLANRYLQLITLSSVFICINAYGQSDWLSSTVPRANYAAQGQNYSNYSGGLSESEILNLSPYNNYYPSQNQSHNISGVSANVEDTISWVVNSGDTNGRPFLIANKRAGELVLVEGGGSIIARSPALYGRKRSDEVGIKQTPAGAFPIARTAAEHPGYGGDVLTFANDDANELTVSIHRVWLESPSERRLERLNSDNPNERRISDGCINVPDSFYNHISDIVNGSKIYVLPETRAYF